LEENITGTVKYSFRLILTVHPEYDAYCRRSQFLLVHNFIQWRSQEFSMGRSYGGGLGVEPSALAVFDNFLIK